jgi:Holliday junction resolvase-like predicted endonuclease
LAAPQQRLGLRAEAAAATWLMSLGWQMLEHRWRSATGELDLVCLDPDGILVGVEVKLRRTSRAGGPAEALDARRIGRLRRTLADYAARRRPRATGLRIDLVSFTAVPGAWRLSLWRGIDQW